MLKSLLLSGWFRVQPFLKYVVIVILISPLVGFSIHSSVAKQSQLQLSKSNSGLDKSNLDSQIKPIARQNDLNLGKVNLLTAKPEKTENVVSENQLVSKERQLLSVEKIDSRVGKEKQQDHISTNNIVRVPKSVAVAKIPVNQDHLLLKLQDPLNETLAERNVRDEVIKTTTKSSKIRKSQSSLITEIPVDEKQHELEAVPDDPIGSPHPIPWKWIMTTQEAIGGQGKSGVRHYRSIPVISPDGRYAVYSRVQLEVQPQMHNSRVNSLLFIEDRQTKRLRVITKTAGMRDPLLNQFVSRPKTDTEGKIKVLIPVSWSKTGDRFLARKFVGIFNTADVTDHAVIWNRQEDITTTVSPVQREDEHEKIAILLGWSQKQPDHVLFRAGELGQENWPLVQVASDGKSVNVTSDGDRPVTFGVKNTEGKPEPQVASR